MASAADQELLPEQTEGFKVAEKKTIDEYHQLGMFKWSFDALIQGPIYDVVCCFCYAFSNHRCLISLSVLVSKGQRANPLPCIS